MDGIPAFEEYLQGRGASKHTVQGYMMDVRIFSDWFEETNREKLTPEKFTPVDLRLYRQNLLNKGAQPSTINRRLAGLRAFGSMLVKNGVISSNPAEGIRMVEKQRLSPKWLEKRDQAALIRQVERQVNAARTEAGKRQAIRDRAAVMLALNAGLRVGEICDLELRDVEIGERSGALHVRAGKGEKARSIPLNKTARAAARLWLQYRGNDPGPSFWNGKHGGGMTPSGLERRVREIGRLAGVEVTPHILRHTFAKSLIDLGVSLEKVAALLGHSRLETTRMYCIPGEADLEKAVGLLDF
jgi:integrase/recombinase XerC